MIKVATISVTVAAGCHVTIPHESGIKELPGRVLSGGAVFSVTPETASDLWAARLILNPQTGALPEPSPAAPKPYQSPGVTISVGGAPMRKVLDGEVIDLTGGIPPDPFNPPEPRSPRIIGSMPPVAKVQYWEGPEIDPNGSGVAIVTQEDGRNWPSW